METAEPLLPGNYYHIFNSGINGCNLFNGKDDYEHFIGIYRKYIEPVAETYAWVLMPNHFHFLIRIRENVVYKFSNADRSADAVRFETHKWETVTLSGSASQNPDYVKIPAPHLHFSHLFNAWSKTFNHKYYRQGSLLNRSFKRNLIKNTPGLKEVLLFIHLDPVKHGFCSHPSEYPWSSYLSCITLNPENLQQKEAIGWFGNPVNFKQCHHSIPVMSEILDLAEM